MNSTNSRGRPATARGLFTWLSLAAAFSAFSFGSAGTARATDFWLFDVPGSGTTQTTSAYAQADANLSVPSPGYHDSHSQSSTEPAANADELVSADAAAGLSSHGEAQSHSRLFGEGNPELGNPNYHIYPYILELHGRAEASGAVNADGGATGYGQASFSGSQSLTSGSWVSGSVTLTRNEQSATGGPDLTFSLGTPDTTWSLPGGANGTLNSNFNKPINGSVNISVNATESQPQLPPNLPPYASFGASGEVTYVAYLMVHGGGDGSDQSHPILPGDELQSAYRFNVTSGQSGLWFDAPATGGGFDYQTTDSRSTFTEVGLPAGLEPSPTQYTINYTLDSILNSVTLPEGTTYTFPQPVSEFTITGIDPTVSQDALNIFSTKLYFNNPTAGFSLTPILPQAVPEPGSLALAALGAAGLEFRRRCRLI